MKQSLGPLLGSVPFAALCGVVGLLGLGLVCWRASQRWALASRRRVQRTAQKAEDSAQALLRAAGYRVVGVQVTRPWPVRLGERTAVVNLVADLLVEKGGRRYVAEVKSGELGTSIRHGPTRRQILEYSLAFGSEAVLLVDARRRRFVPVGFPNVLVARGRLRGRGGWLAALIALALGTCLGFVLSQLRMGGP